MSAGFEEKARHIFPRWRSFKATNTLGELALPTLELRNDLSELDLSLANGIAGWKADPSLWRGLDLLGTVTVAGKLDDFSALINEVKGNPLTPPVAGQLLDKLQRGKATLPKLPDYDEIPNLGARIEISAHRFHLAFAPHDPIEWIELARNYTIVGSNEKARKAIMAALQLAPNNRFVLRSAARFFLHNGEQDRALNLLSKAQTIKVDPWIMASEIAIADSMGKVSRFSRIAREKMEMDIAPSEVSELASALGSLEAESGNHRVARRFLRRALVGANENSIAQIRWLNRQHLQESVDASNANPPLLHEANAWASYYKGEFEVARSEALNWLRDQPFASAPAALSSYILSDIFGDFETGKAIASAALKSNPEDSTLLNNLAVCLMELGQVAEAETTLSRLRTDGHDKRMDSIYKATFGMLAFRKGNIEEGRKLYLEAIQDAKDFGSKATAARAAIHLFLEESVAGTAHVSEAILRIKEFKEQENLSEIICLLDRVNRIMENQQWQPFPRQE